MVIKQGGATMTEARQALLTRIDSEVRAYRAALEAETRETCGELSAADALLLDAICDTERIRREAVAQIAEKGLRERYSNGRQSLERENKAVGQAHKAAQTLGKLMAALKARQRKGQAGAQAGAEGLQDEVLGLQTHAGIGTARGAHTPAATGRVGDDCRVEVAAIFADRLGADGVDSGHAGRDDGCKLKGR